jgi:hypothetical protein
VLLSAESLVTFMNKRNSLILLGTVMVIIVAALYWFAPNNRLVTGSSWGVHEINVSLMFDAYGQYSGTSKALSKSERKALFKKLKNTKVNVEKHPNRSITSDPKYKIEVHYKNDKTQFCHLRYS